MSRAFVKEIDDAPSPPPPERPISTAPNRVTPRGARLIDEAVAGLEKQLGALRSPEGAALLRRDLRYWLARQASMQIVPAAASPEQVAFGTQVTIMRGTRRVELTIVGEDEADPSKGLIAWTAPLARALDGAEAGEEVEFEAGGHLESATILSISDKD